MNIKYKTIHKDLRHYKFIKHEVVDYGEFCCEAFKDAVYSSFIHFNDDVVGIQYYHTEYDNCRDETDEIYEGQPMKFCPYCGKPITLEKVEEVRVIEEKVTTKVKKKRMVKPAVPAKYEEYEDEQITTVQKEIPYVPE